MDHAEPRPPQIIVVDVAPCADSIAASDELRQAVAHAMAPTAEWKIRVRFARPAGRLTVQGEVIDPTDHDVATRVLATAGGDCASLARGLGVWAALVLDSEVERVSEASSHAPNRQPLGPITEESETAPDTRKPETPAPAPAPPLDADRSSPEHDLFLHHEPASRAVELGLASFVMGGTGGGAVVGPSAFGVFEAAHGFFLRPALVVGHSVGGFSPTTEAPATFLGSRFDACLRLPGLYHEGRGLQLDGCGGAEVGFSLVDASDLSPNSAAGGRTLPFVALGPSLGLRGDITRNLSAMVRGVGDVSFLRDEVTVASGAVVQPALFVGRAEVGLSWSLR